MIVIVPALATMLMLQPAVVIDDFESVAGWKAIPSDDVSLTVGQDAGARGKSMRLDFDLRGHGGYAVVHRDVNLTLPANYEFSFSIRGDAPVNTLEFKLIDPSGDNVWWSNQPGFVFPREWRTILRKKRHITFAWGPAGGGEMKTVAGIEIAITAGTGGKGTVWIDDLVLTPLEPQGEYNLQPKLTAGSAAGGYEAARAMDRDSTTSWRVGRGSPDRQWLEVDFLKRREFGGLVLDWEKDLRPAAYSVSTSLDGKTWTTGYTVRRSTASRDYLYLPESDARYVRVSFAGIPGAEPTASAGLKEITVQPLAWSASMNDFFAAVARDAVPGSYPRYFTGRQSYWTVVGVSGDSREGLIDQQGLLESGKGQFSVEPFLHTGGRLYTWNDVTTTPGSTCCDLPIPYVTWKTPSLDMTVAPFVGGAPDSSVLFARYRVRNTTKEPQRATLYLAIRPFQVNPPWQFLNTQGGFARVDSIMWFQQRAMIVPNRRVIPVSPPAAFGATSFDQGNIVELLRQNRLPTTPGATDPLGRASGAFSFEIELAAGGDSTITLAIPMHAAIPAFLDASGAQQGGEKWVEEQFNQVVSSWRSKLDRVSVQVPASASRIPSTIRANLGYILINRDGPAIQPGSRSYERSWIRDGALTSAAMLRLRQYDEVRDFIDWYAGFQFDNGKIPCCVDSRGADPVPENDSHGEFIYLVAEYHRHTRDRALLERRWPNVSRAFAFMDSLRRSRTTAEYTTGDRRVFYGLMPQSISHEGYSAKPMHSYWDDFFAMRGFKDAAEIAAILGKPEAVRYAQVRDQFRKDFYASITLAMQQHRIDYIPGAAELGDFDATSTTIALNRAEEQAHLPAGILERTFEKYYESFRTRRDSAASWEIYTPYEWRVVGTFVRMGQKARAHEVADFFFQHQRPGAWHQWAEVVYRDSLNPKFIGDMPHTWVGSDFIRSALDMFAYERESDSSLVIGAGIPEKWEIGRAH